MKDKLNPRFKRAGDGSISGSRIRICTSRKDDNEIIEYVDDITDTSKKFVTARVKSRAGVKSFIVVENPNYRGE